MQHPKSSQPLMSADHQVRLEGYLRELKLPMFLQFYQTYARNTAHSGLSNEWFFLASCEAEITERRVRRIERAITTTKFSFAKEIAAYDFSAVENSPKTRILELAVGGYPAKAENLLLLGNLGRGKTHLANGLALAACRQGKRLRFYGAAKLVNEPAVPRKDLRLSCFIAQYVKLDLLVLDELRFLSIDREGTQMLFQLISDLYERMSIIVASNLRFTDWNSIFGDEKMTHALIGQFKHIGHMIKFVGETYRFRYRLQQEEKSTKGDQLGLG